MDMVFDALLVLGTVAATVGGLMVIKVGIDFAFKAGDLGKRAVNSVDPDDCKF